MMNHFFFKEFPTKSLWGDSELNHLKLAETTIAKILMNNPNPNILHFFHVTNEYRYGGIDKFK